MLKTIASVRVKEGNAFHTVFHPGPVGQELPPGHEGQSSECRQLISVLAKLIFWSANRLLTKNKEASTRGKCLR